MSTKSPPENIVIIGGGIIGICSAYYLSTHPSFSSSRTTITLLEASSIAAGASGKAGGLLAQWAYPACIVPLSYRLHAELAAQYGGEKRWGYRQVKCGSLEAVGKAVGQSGSVMTDRGVSLEKRPPKKKKKGRRAVPGDLDWLSEDAVQAYESMAGEGKTAQVHPKLFTQAMAEEAEKNGVKIVFGRATKLDISSSTIKSVSYISKDAPETTETLPASTVVLAAGPWSQTLLPTIPHDTVRAHSVVIRPAEPVSRYVLFTSITQPASPAASHRTVSRTVTPEIYARPDGTVYACGEGDRVAALPETAGDVIMDAKRCDELLADVTSVSEVLQQGQVVARQACYLPNVAQGGGPLVGWSSKVAGLVVATGHTCWGIQNSAGTGILVSELVWEGKTKSADVGRLDPKHWGV